MPVALPPSFAPMEINFVKSIVLENKWRCAFTLLTLLFLIFFGLTAGVAQFKNQKRVTSLEISDGNEGARVTVFSDSALNDYEAFRRGDRFYVRIPLADFTAARPNFRGDGFEDVQVQKVGDSVIVSFKLEPGATARVDQRANRLDVIFSAPGRMARQYSAYPGSNRAKPSPASGTARVSNAPRMQRRESDAAGPTPPGSPQASRARVVAERVDPERIVERQMTPGTRAQIKAGDADKRTNQSASNTSTNSDSSVAAPPSTSSSYPATAIGTPAAPVSSKPVENPFGPADSGSWNSRSQLARRWVSANRLVTLLGALALLTLILFTGAMIYRRRTNLVKTKRVRAPRAQPKYSPDIELGDLLARPVSAAASSEESNAFANEYWADVSQPDLSPSIAAPGASQASAAQQYREWLSRVSEPEVAQPFEVGMLPNDPWSEAMPSISPSTAGAYVANSDEQEREVFEL